MRLQNEKPYSPSAKLITPLKTATVLLVLASGLVWLVGSMLGTGVVPGPLTLASAIVFIVLLAAYSITSITVNHRRERKSKKDLEARDAVMAGLAESGFQPTFKSIGSSRAFYVDEKMGKWILLDYFNAPQKARLHNVSSITTVAVGSNRVHVPAGHTILMFNGKRLNEKDSDSYFSKDGVVLYLDEEDCPTVFINCFKTENDVGIISSYLQNLLEKQRRPSA